MGAAEVPAVPTPGACGDALAGAHRPPRSRPVRRLHLVHRPGEGTSGIRPVEACSILFCSDDHKGRGGSLGRKVARPPAPDCAVAARYFAVISAGMVAPSLAQRNVLPSTQIR